MYIGQSYGNTPHYIHSLLPCCPLDSNLVNRQYKSNDLFTTPASNSLQVKRPITQIQLDIISFLLIKKKEKEIYFFKSWGKAF